MPSPPKPWEVNSNNSSVAPVTTSTANMTTTTATTTASAPAVPNRPTTMGSAYGGLGTSSYGGMYGSSYSSPYNRYGYGGGGGYGGYNSYGGYGSTYGGYGSSYSPYNRFGGYGYNRFGGGGGGMFGEGPDNNSLTQRMEASTRATFDVIESIVQAFGGFAQMLDSTYMATHSSFMAMVGVAEQFGNLRHYLGNIFNVFALLRWLRRLFYRLIGRTPPAEPVEDNEGEPLQITEDEQPPEAVAPSNSNKKRRSVILFLAIVTGLPYVIYKLIQKSHERMKEQQQQRMMIPQYGGPIETARVIHDFIGENPMELTIRKGDLVYILSKIDPATGLPCDWWQGRLPNGAIGIFPANHVSVY